MRFSPLFVCVGLLVMAHPLHANGSLDVGLYQTVRSELRAARAAATIQQTAGRLLKHPQVRTIPALRKFVSGFAALMSYERTAAERDLAESFRLAPSAHVAAALAANAIEIGRAAPALHWIDRALPGPDVAADPLLDAELRAMRSQAVGWLSKYDEQRAEARVALTRARASGDQRALALALRAVGQASGSSGERQLGLETIEEALRLSQAAGDVAAVGYHLFIRAVTIDTTTETKLQALDGAVLSAQRVRDRQLEGRAAGSRGAVLLVLGRYEKALRDLSAADALLRETGALRSRATVAGNLSLLFTELGDYGRAEAQSRLATRLYRLIDNPWGARQTLDDLGRLALARGDVSLAVSRHERVVAMTREWGDTDYLRQALVHLGLAYLARGDHRAAERHVREGLRMMDAEHNPDEPALAHAALADVLRRTGRAAEAEREYQLALAMRPDIQRQGTVLLRAHHGLGLIDAQAGRWEAAMAHYRIAIGEIERGRTAARQPSLQLTYFAEKSALYIDAIETLVDAYRHTADTAHLREALAFAERAKARTLFDTMAGTAQPAGAEAPHAVEQMASTLAPADLLIEYVAGPKRSFVFTLASDASITVDQLPPRAIIEQQVRAVREVVARRPAPGAGLDGVRRTGRRAHSMLLAPALSARRQPDGGTSVTRLIIVADGLLVYTPFEALMDSADTYLAERFEVVRAASASVLAATRTRRRAPLTGASHFVGFGDPHVSGAPQTGAELVRALERDGFSFAPLPASRREIEAAAALHPGSARVYTGRDFTAQAVLAELQRPNRVVHFATHAVLDERVPERSGIVLSTTADDGAPAILRARDLEGLTIPVDLVTLSACQTGLGRIVAGEGVLGLAWAFTRAGAGSLIVTLWSVSDASSATTTIAFYRALEAGQSKSAALRTARLETLRASPALRHPFFWAGHVLIGDPD